MAEAHSAVAFSFSITHEGVHINYDFEVLDLVWQSGLRSWKKRYARFRNNIKNGVYPASLRSLQMITVIIIGSYFLDIDLTFGAIKFVESLIPGENLAPKMAFLISCLITSFIIWILLILLFRYTLKALFMYKGWMYEPRKGPISLKSRLWIILIKALEGRNPLLHSYQASLPHLPLPSLDSTMNRYLKSVRPLLDDSKYDRIEQLTTEFKNGIGRKLQRYLWLKSWWSSNYVSDWWEEYVYLRGRSPLMVNSNFYGIDALFVHPTHNQAARAANLIHAALLFRRSITTQQLRPILVQHLVPLCSWQYERIFNTVRIPGIETDKLIHLPDSQHVAVYHAGRFFKLPVYFKNRLLKPVEIQMQIEKILKDENAPLEGEEHLAALTASDRATWAKARAEFFHKGINKRSLDAIEKSAFFVALDDDDYEFDPDDSTKLDRFGRAMLHGKGYDRWFDKSFTLIIGKNGRVGLNAEHSWADAPIMSHLWEYCLAHDFVYLGYTDEGNTRGRTENNLPPPIRLKWDLTPECIQVIKTSVIAAQELLKDVDLKLCVHNSYGKGFMKKCKVSPDAYIQMALQLAYFRDAGKFSLTYEASMTRFFREGRTETVRPVTSESCAWVRAMLDSDCPVSKKQELLVNACNTHQKGYQDAMCGKGIDRHLFCLYVVSKYLEVDSPFLKEVLSEPWRLSTSQTPHGQTELMDVIRNPEYISAGGGFGPVADDGYGVSYIIAGEDTVFFHISSKKSSPETDSHRFGRQIERSLADIKQLFEKKI